jgi:hypothetical protein
MNFISERVHLDNEFFTDGWLLGPLEQPNADLAFRTIGEDLLKREWWKRIWVIQELASARREPSIPCGQFECGWDQFIAALMCAGRNNKHQPVHGS